VKRLSAKLCVVALLIDGETSIALDEDTAIGGRNKIVERRLLLARQQ
jgi:hypothetical protein